MNDRARERDLILAPNEYAFIADETKGNINAYIGPYKTSLANTDQPVVFNPETKRFERCALEGATRSFAVAPVGWYMVLKNPAKDGSHPKTGAINNLNELEIGRKVNLPGPAAFALWPGQMVRVIQGHNLRSNQYLIVRVYDEEAAQANWKHAVIKRQGSARRASILEGDPPDLTMGKQLVIKGTDVCFYIPSTGIEVVRDESRRVRARGRHPRAARVLHPARRGRQQDLPAGPRGRVPAADRDLRRARTAPTNSGRSSSTRTAASTSRSSRPTRTARAAASASATSCSSPAATR